MLCWCLIGVAAAQEAAPTRPFRATLDNGMVVILKEDRSAPILTMQVWVRAGSIHEDTMLGSGVSHFVEHMLFKGTKKRAVGQFAQEIKAAGGTLNASTRREVTVYHVTIRSAFFEMALDALSDVIMHSSFDPEETAKEREVIIKELEEDEDDPNMKLHFTFASLAYRVHPYRLPVGGYVSQFKTITREQLLAYYAKMYVPNNMVFIMVGDFDTKTVFPKIQAAFKDFARKPLPPIYVPEEPRQVGKRFAAVTHPNARTCTLQMGFHTVSLRHPDLFALDMLALILGSGETSRLTRRLKYELELVKTISAVSYTPQYPGMFYIRASFDEVDKSSAIEKAVLEEIEKFKTDLVSTEELERAKNRVLAEYWFSRQTVEEQAEALGISELWADNLAFDELYVAGIKQVTAEQIREVARKYLYEDNLTVVVLSPQQEEPRTEEVVERVDTPVVPPTELAAPLKLSCGISVVIKERSALPLVTLCATVNGGVRAETEKNNGVCNIMTIMLTKGTRTRSREKIAELIESVGGRLEPTSGRNTFMLSISVLKEHLPLAVDLLSDMLMNPAFDEKEFDIVKKTTLFNLKREAEDPFNANIREVHKALYGSHPYARLPQGTYESVSLLTREDVVQFHETFCRPSNMVIAVVGDVNRQEVVEMLENAFKGFTDAPVPLPAFPPLPEQKEAVRIELQGTQPALGVGSLVFRTVSMRDRDRYAFDVLDSLLGSMGGRIFVSLRDRDALAYELGCASRVQLDRGFFWFFVRTSPENIEKFFEGVRRELDLLVSDGIPAEELERAKNSVIGAFIADQQTNSSQAMSLALDTIYDIGEHATARYPEHISAVTADDIKRIVKTYLAPENAVVVVINPAERRDN